MQREFSYLKQVKHAQSLVDLNHHQEDNAQTFHYEPTWKKFHPDAQDPTLEDALTPKRSKVKAMTCLDSDHTC